MTLVRLIYTSTVADNLNAESVEAILATAKINNAKQNVTGILYFSNRYFLQCLEGERDTVNHLYNTIINDVRHLNIVILEYREIDQRDFYDWTMGYIPHSNATKPLTLKYFATNNFNPYQATGASAYLLLLDLKKSLLSI